LVFGDVWFSWIWNSFCAFRHHAPFLSFPPQFHAPSPRHWSPLVSLLSLHILTACCWSFVNVRLMFWLINRYWFGAWRISNCVHSIPFLSNQITTSYRQRIHEHSNDDNDP
jgi:hypothetical protein